MSEKKEIVRAAGILGFATILSRIMGMARDMVVSRLFGAGLATDAFFAAFQIPNMLRRFFAEGALTSAFVPTFTEHYEKDPEDAKHLARSAFSLLIIVMFFVTAAGIIFSPLIVRVMFPGFAQIPEKLSLTIFLNRLMFPYIFFVSLVALCMGILNTVRHFFTPAISTVFLNICMIASAVFLHDKFNVPITALAIGVIAGGAVQLLLQIPVLFKKGFRPGFVFKNLHPALKNIVLLMGPSVFGVGVYYLNITVSGILASLLPQGSVSYLYYAQRFFEFPQGIFTVSVAQAVLPSLSRQAAAGDVDAMKDSLSFGLRMIIFITIPAMAGLWSCSTPIFSLLFMGGEFSYQTAVNSASALQYYVLGLTFVAMVRVTVPAFYAMKDTRSPVIAALAAFIANFIFSLILMKPMLHSGLALASSLSAVVNILLLFYFLRKKVGAIDWGKISSTMIRSLAASIPMGIAVSYIVNILDWSYTGDRVLKVVVITGSVISGILIYTALARIFGCEEVKDAIALVSRKFRRHQGA